MLHTIVRMVSSGSARWQAIVGSLFVLVLAIDQFGLHFFTAIEHRGSDYFLRHHAAEFKADPNIVVVDIDDQSMVAMQEMAVCGRGRVRCMPICWTDWRNFRLVPSYLTWRLAKVIVSILKAMPGWQSH